MEQAFHYIMQNNIATEESYNYTAKKGNCKSGINSGIKITGYKFTERNEQALKEAVGNLKCFTK